MVRQGGNPSPAPAQPVPLTAAGEPPLSCTSIGITQAKLRRLRDWARENKQPYVYQLANEAWNELEVVRVINKELRRQLKRARGTKGQE